MSEIYKKKVIIALGHFDCVHIGHRAVIEKTTQVAKTVGAKSAVFLFNGDLKSALNKSNKKSLYSLEKRVDLIKALGITDFYFAPVDSEFLSLSKQKFLDKINEEFDILGYVCGADYRFGFKAEGDVEFLKLYALDKGQTVDVLPIFTADGQKISSTLIKEYIADGNMDKANALLGEKYSIEGIVEKDRGIGGSIGFPTVNVNVGTDFLTPKNAVYAGETDIDQKTFSCVINFGARPTFNDDNKVLEAHIIGFSGDLYGKRVRIKFDRLLREIVKFSSVNELKIQLTKDIKRVTNND